MRTLELIVHYRCNARCTVCVASTLDQSRVMAPSEAIDYMRRARADGARKLVFGGGEPTLHSGLPELIAAASALGFEDIEVHTNGLLLASVDRAHALAEAGLSTVVISLKGHIARTHNGAVQVPGAFETLRRSARAIVEVGLGLSIDPLITTTTGVHLPDLTRFASDLGATRVSFWLLFLEPRQRSRLGGQLPTLGALTSSLSSALRLAVELGMEARSYHMPPCFLDADVRALSTPERSLSMAVAEPGGPLFELGTTEFSEGQFQEGCESCSARSSCPGIRSDYLEIHGWPLVSPV